MSEGNTDTWLNDKPGEDGLLCPLCNGAQFVYPLLALGQPDYSRVVPCRCIQEQLQKRKIADLQKFSNLGSLSRLTFDNLLPDGRNNVIKAPVDFTKAYEAAKSFAEDPTGWLIFIAPPGCGKTHLACAIANYCISIAQPAFYIETADLLDHLRSTFYAESDIAAMDIFERVKNTPLLILDDLAMTVTTPWTRGKLEQLLNHRFNLRLPTVMTSHIPVENLEASLQGHLTDPEMCRVYVLQHKSSILSESLDGMELELLKKMSFDNFDCKRLNLPVEERQNLEQAYRIALDFAESPQGWLMFLGDNGCGKTHLAAAIANHVRQNDKEIMFIVVPDFLDHLRSAFGPESRISYDDLFEKVKKVPVLILDDFGEQAATPWTQEKIYQLINYRYNARLATVITTCFPLDDIESRISSRMVDPSISLVFSISAPDYRGDRKAIQRTKLRQKFTKPNSKL